jgi:hypothetical protein
MELTLLAMPDCPNAAVLEQRLAEALSDWPGVTVTRRVIADVAEAARWGMQGSPTLLVNGADPFALPGAVPALACRIYVGENGRLEGAPSVDSLCRVMKQAGSGAGPEGVRG